MENWDPYSENVNPLKLREWTTQILKVLSRFTESSMPCLLMHQDIHIGNLAVLMNGDAALVDFGRSSCIATMIDLDTIKASVIESYEKLSLGKSRDLLAENLDSLKYGLRDANEDGKPSAGAQQDLLHAFGYVALTSKEPFTVAEKYKKVFVNQSWPFQFVESMSHKNDFLIKVRNLFAPRDTLQFMSTLKEFMMEAGISKTKPEIAPIMTAMKNLEESYMAQDGA